MPRVKRGPAHLKKRKRLLSRAKGFKWGRKSKIKLAKTAVVKAGAYARRDRRAKKRSMRALWLIRLNAAVRERGTSYSKFISAVKKHKVELDRRVLSELAMTKPKIFDKIFEEIIKK